MNDLFLLVADKNARFAMEGALRRPKALGIHPITYQFRVHSGRDGGARKSGPDILRLERKRFRHGLLVLDFEGSGTFCSSGLELEEELDDRVLSLWGRGAKAIVIEPELDVWIWGSDHAIEQEIGWPPGCGIRNWIRQQGFAIATNNKPVRPKEALEAAMHQCGLPRSSATYQRIAESISLRRCTDDAFLRLRTTLQTWFPQQIATNPGTPD